MTELSSTERRNLIAVGLRTTAHLREFCRNDGVAGLGDFLNGLIMSGLSLQFRLEGKGSFISVLEEEIASARATRLSEAFQTFEGKLASRDLAEVTAEKSSLSIIASVACEGEFVQVANKIKIDKQTMLRMIAMGVVGVVCDASEDSDLDEHLRVALWSAREKEDSAKLVADMLDEDEDEEDPTAF